MGGEAASRKSSAVGSDAAAANSSIPGEYKQLVRPLTAPTTLGDSDHGSPGAGGGSRQGSLAYGHFLHDPVGAGAGSPSGRPTTAFLRGLKQSPPGCLTGLMHRSNSPRPGSPGPVGAGSGTPLFEIRGASLLGSSAVQASQPASPKLSSTQAYDSFTSKGGAQAGVTYSVHAQPGGYAAIHRSSSGGGSRSHLATGASPYASPQRQQQQQRPGTPLVGEPLGSPTHQRTTGAASAHTSANPTPRPPQQRPRNASSSSTSSSTSSSARSSVSGADSSAPYTTYHVPLSLAGQGSSGISQGPVQQAGAGAAAAAAASYPQHLTHHNPLFSSTLAAAASGEGPGAAAAVTRGQSPTLAGRQQAQQGGTPGGGMAGLSISTRAPPSPKAGLSSAGATPTAHGLQAASNLTMVNDSRPISPGPFLSTYISGSAPDSSSRPVSPHFMDQPPTPGSFATGPEAQGTSPFLGITPLRPGAASQQQPWSASSPSSPEAAATVATAAPAGVPSVGFRTPIYNRDGKFVGWKQNSNLVKPRGPTMSVPYSSPSSPSKATSSSEGQFKPTDSAEASAMAPPAAGTPKAQGMSPRALDADFAQFAAEPNRGFPDEANCVPGYVLGPVLGKGGFCSVRKALHQLTGQTVACKIIEKTRLKDPKDRDRVDRECRVMKILSNHASIIKMYEYVETPEYIYIMMEHCTKGSLLEYVRDKKKLPEEEAVSVLQQLLHALQFCHRKDVVHRDIKLENILIDGDGHMKLIDFGLCGYYVAGKRLRCHCGSPSYAAPEIVARKDYLGPPVDVWSLGIVLFATLAGYLPFHAKEKKQLSEKILAGVYKNPPGVSSDATDLLSRMLTLDPDARITLEGVWAHPWVARAKRWEPPGVGSGRIYRMLTDPSTGSIIPDEGVMERLVALGVDGAAVRRALRMRECNGPTAAYHLQYEAMLAEQKAAKEDFRWDFSCLPRSPNKQQQQQPPSSPTRFQQELIKAVRVEGPPAGTILQQVAGSPK